jgi:hypothetical protein
MKRAARVNANTGDAGKEIDELRSPIGTPDWNPLNVSHQTSVVACSDRGSNAPVRADAKRSEYPAPTSTGRTAREPRAYLPKLRDRSRARPQRRTAAACVCTDCTETRAGLRSSHDRVLPFPTAILPNHELRASEQSPPAAYRGDPRRGACRVGGRYRSGSHRDV